MSGGARSSPSNRRATRPASRSSRAARGSGRNVVASPGRPPRAVRRDRPRGRGACPPALDRAGPRRGVGRRRRILGRRRGGRGDVRARGWPDRCSSGSTSPRPWRGSTTGRWSGSTTSRATSTPPGCAIPARPIAPDPVFPLVALVVSGGHTFLVGDARPPDLSTPRLDRRRRRRRGVRQGRPAARPRLPGRSGDRPRRPRPRPGTTASSRGPGWATRTTSASPGSRPPPGGSSPRPGPTPASPTTPTSRCPTPSSPSSRGASRTRSSTSS